MEAIGEVFGCEPIYTAWAGKRIFPAGVQAKKDIITRTEDFPAVAAKGAN